MLSKKKKTDFGLKTVFCTDKVVVALLGSSVSADCLCEAVYPKGNEGVVEDRFKASPFKMKPPDEMQQVIIKTVPKHFETASIACDQ